MSVNNLVLSYKFLIVGVANTVFGLCVIFGLMYFFGLNPTASNLIGYASGFVLGFFLNKNWSFKYKVLKQKGFFRYLFVILIAYFFNIVLVSIGTILFNLNPYISQIVGMVIYTTVSFVGCNQFVFQIKS
jgi:putative flippase GtrA